MSINLASVFLNFLGIFLTIFFVWRRTREDYISDAIFGASILIVAGVLVGSLGLSLALVKLPESAIFSHSGLWFWGGFFGFLVAFIAATSKLKLKRIELFEASGVGLLIWLMTAEILAAPVITLVAGLCVLLFFQIDARYKRLSWYRSGRVGFAGFSVMGIFFLARAVIAFVDPSMITLIGRVDVVMSALVAFLMFFVVYNLSQS